MCVLSAIKSLILQVLWIISILGINTRANENVYLKCSMDSVTLSVVTTQPFYGRIYAQSSSSFLSTSTLCEVFGNGATEISLTLDYTNSQCGVHQEEADVFVAVAVIQHHPLVQQQGDRALRLVCDFRIKNFTVSNAYNMAVADHIHGGGIVNSSAPSPGIRMRILDKRGQDVTDTKLGQDLLIRVEIDQNSIFGLAPRSLIASSGHSSEHIELLDENGCPTDNLIFAGLNALEDSKNLQGQFQAFKFSDDVIVRFHLNVQFCVKQCPIIRCDFINHDKHLQKRSSWEWNMSSTMPSLTDPFLPLQREIIVDGATVTHLPYPPPSSTANSKVSREDDGFLCVTKTVLTLIIAAATILQLCILVTCILCIWVSRKYQNRDDISVSSDHELMNPEVSATSDTIFYSDGFRTRL